MSAPVNQRVSPNRVALIGVLLLAAWLVFEFYPRKPKPTPPVAQVMTESKLHAVGLTDNPDWDGLPEIFAIWADKAEWKDGRTRFAYWHPVMKTYSYYFEATRNGARVSFKEIAEPHDSDYFLEDYLDEKCPIRFYYSDSVPKPIIPVQKPHFGIIDQFGPDKAPHPDPLPPPPIELKLQPPDIEKKH